MVGWMEEERNRNLLFLSVPAQHQLMHQFLLTHHLTRVQKLRASPHLAPTITGSLVLIIYNTGTVLSEVNVCHIAGFS